MNRRVLPALAESHEERARDWYGWTPEPSARVCPRELAGLGCLNMVDDPAACWCSRFYPALLDHGHRWRRDDGSPLLTGEPYEFGGADLAEFVAQCDGVGLHVELCGESPYYPGHTVLIAVYPEGGGEPW